MPPGRSLEELLSDLFGSNPGGPSGPPSVPTSPGDALSELLEDLFGSIPDGPGSYPSGPGMPIGGSDHLADLLLGRHPGVVDAPEQVVDAKSDPEWEGNVPPDLTDGFDFLL